MRSKTNPRTFCFGDGILASVFYSGDGILTSTFSLASAFCSGEHVLCWRLKFGEQVSPAWKFGGRIHLNMNLVSGGGEQDT